MLDAHCADVGREPAEILRSVQIAVMPDQDPAEVAATAAALGEVGVEKLILTLRTPYRADRVEPLAKELASLA